MMQIKLITGVWFNGAGAIIAGGGGAVTGATTAGLVQFFGWALMALGVCLFVWGIRINDRHVWRCWWKPRRSKGEKDMTRSLKGARPKSWIDRLNELPPPPPTGSLLAFLALGKAEHDYHGPLATPAWHEDRIRLTISEADAWRRGFGHKTLSNRTRCSRSPANSATM